MLRKIHYLQDMKAKNIPKDAYHVARWHLNGKLWISRESQSPVESDAQIMADGFNAIVTPGAINTPYFVWHHSMTAADLEPYRAERSANKIK